MSVTNCICIKYGTLYGPEYTNRLYAGLKRWATSDIRMFCMTDDANGIDPSVEILPLPSEPFHARMFKAMETTAKRGRLQKISMFRPDLVPDLQGPVMVFDLDVVITGDVVALRDYKPGKICMRREWNSGGKAPSLGHGSVERFDPKLHPYLYTYMAENTEEAVEFANGSEQSYTSRLADREGDFEPFPDEWIVSFKYACRPPRPLNLVIEPRLPKDAKVVCFHGRPKMEEAVEGYQAGLLHSTRPCGWMKEYWIGG
ncbi:MAG: glycosyl transferase [Pseudomonadota bacterium]